MAKKTTPIAPVTPTIEFRVVGPAKGRWRAGRLFGPEPMTLTDLDLTEDQIDQLGADPELVVMARGYVVPEGPAEPQYDPELATSKPADTAPVQDPVTPPTAA